MRRPRGGDGRTSPSRAAPGLRPGALSTPCQELADGRGNPMPKARPGAAKPPPWRAERRRTLATRCALGLRLRLFGAPSPRFTRGATPPAPCSRGGRRKGNTGDPGARQTTRAIMHVCFGPHAEEGAKRPSRSMATGPHGSRRAADAALLTMRGKAAGCLKCESVKRGCYLPPAMASLAVKKRTITSWASFGGEASRDWKASRSPGCSMLRSGFMLQV
jgi:hypothetical protein